LEELLQGSETGRLGRWTGKTINKEPAAELDAGVNPALNNGGKQALSSLKIKKKL
jgi:hypothetical protein